jgi:RNA polymerase sigma-70 factor (ECF subfamily)
MNLSTEFPDERLKLLFVCAHPAIDPAMHTPLMLQTVLGLDAARIGGAFLISPKTMGQRLVRAKIKIRDGGIRFEIPDKRELPARLEAVLEAIYAAFGIAWDDLAGVDQRGRDLTEEAIWLARVLLQLIPNDPEVHGLLALMLYCESRRAARRGPDRRYIPLSEQDTKQWSMPLIEEAEQRVIRHNRTLHWSRCSAGNLQALDQVESELSQRIVVPKFCAAPSFPRLVEQQPRSHRILLLKSRNFGADS